MPFFSTTPDPCINTVTKEMLSIFRVCSLSWIPGSLFVAIQSIFFCSFFFTFLSEKWGMTRRNRLIIDLNLNVAHVTVGDQCGRKVFTKFVDFFFLSPNTLKFNIKSLFPAGMIFFCNQKRIQTLSRETADESWDFSSLFFDDAFCNKLSNTASYHSLLPFKV